MLDQILSSLKDKATPELMNQLGLNADQANGSVMAAADSVKQVVSGGDGFAPAYLWPAVQVVAATRCECAVLVTTA